jgi:hypothetical protein
MVPETDKRTALLSQAEAIVSAGRDVTAEQGRRLARLSQCLAIPPVNPAAPAASRRNMTVTKKADARKLRGHA